MFIKSCDLVLICCRYEWEQERLEEEERLRAKLQLEQEARDTERGVVDHDAVLKALSRALEATEDSYLEMAYRYFNFLVLFPR